MAGASKPQATPASVAWTPDSNTANHSAKPVITLQDSGGPTEIVEHEKTGYIVEPEIEKFGQTLKRLMEDRELAEKLGTAAQKAAAKHTWENVINKLVEW